MSAISAAMAARSHSAAGAGRTVYSGSLLAASQFPSSAPSPSGSAPLRAPPAPEAAPVATEEAAWAAAEEDAAREAAVQPEAAGKEGPVALVAATVGVAVAAVQVQHYLHLCTKKSRDWVAVQARFSPSLGVAWQATAAITSK